MNPIAPLHVRSTLCFSQGTGGHFLLGAAGHGWREINVHYNEYKAHVPWCDLEEITIEELIDHMYDAFDTDTAHVADIQMLASDWRQNLTDNHPEATNLASHVLPVVTSRYMDFHTEELILLPAADDLKEYIAALCFIKSMFTSDWSKYPFKIWSVLTAYRPVSHRPALQKKFHADMNRFRTALSKANVAPREFINDSCIAWCWSLECMRHDWDIGDINQFRQWVTRRLHGMLEITGQLQDSLLSLKQIKYQKLISLNYADIFFDLKPPASSLLADLDMSQVDGYVLKNHQILYDMLGIFDQSVQDSICQTVRRSKHSF